MLKIFEKKIIKKYIYVNTFYDKNKININYEKYKIKTYLYDIILTNKSLNLKNLYDSFIKIIKNKNKKHIMFFYKIILKENFILFFTFLKKYFIFRKNIIKFDLNIKNNYENDFLYYFFIIINNNLFKIF